MRSRFISSLVLVLSLAAIQQAGANPGDTTWVQAQDDVQLDYYNDFDTQVTFPDGSVSYRRIIMIFTLGKYQCPAGTQYCGDWDYTIQNFLMTSTDTFELSRLITPYANASYPRTPWNWKERYYFDVTDFYPYLKNAATIRLSYHNYSGGFTGNIRFAFIEGTPPRNVTGITRLWDGAFNYGDVNNPIESHVSPVSITAPAGTLSAEMKFTVTGHGADNNGCSEFCNRYYQVKQNGSVSVQRNIWKADCGLNNLYPQSGTWIYNRANWCPGELVLPASHSFSSITAGTGYTADVDFQPYTKSGTGNPVYIVSGVMVHYAGFNFNLDASVEDIVSPGNFEGHFRSNPMCGNPVVRIRNTGATAIQSLSFQYGIAGQSMQTFTATGLNIAPMEAATITLPELAGLTTMQSVPLARFTVTIQDVNGTADAHIFNNSLDSWFTTAPDWPAQFQVVMKTNNFGTQTRWKIENLSGTIIAQRNPSAPQTNYTDDIATLVNGCYRLVVTDDACDGLYWWANASQTGTGWIYTRQTDGTLIPFTNGLPAYPSGLSQDFGCGFTQYFRVSDGIPTSIDPVQLTTLELSVNPNPFTGRLHISIGTGRGGTARLQLFNTHGVQMRSMEEKMVAGINDVVMSQLEKLPPGVYLLVLELNGQRVTRKVVK